MFSWFGKVSFVPYTKLSDFAVQIAPSDPAPGVALEATVVGDVGDVTWSWIVVPSSRFTVIE